MNNLEAEIKYLTKNFGIRPQRESGQNFLVDEEVLDAIVDSAQLKPDDNVLEIGAGFGPLTKKLAEKVNKVWAVELEKRFIPALKKLEKSFPAIEVIHQDIIKMDVSKLMGGEQYKIVANIPYNITSYVLRKFLEQDPKPKTMSVLIQKEVAERITAKPSELSLLAVSVQYFGNPRIVRAVSKDCFWPKPKVDSSVIMIEGIKSDKQIKEENTQNGYNFTQKQFFQVVKGGFSAKRKQIHNNLTNSFHADAQKIKGILSENGIKPELRPQDITINDWKSLTMGLILAKILE
ncbi:MAG: 16S rRNA (adenine(1518)-N(6)/adenine(1519)-N(6))-dimethyltransferase RsmA [Patescibacteria group bacterium]